MRQIAKRLKPSVPQLYRLLDSANTRKSMSQLLALLHVLDCDVDLGMSVQARLLIVCHCERESDIIRIYSARKADKSERKQYEGYRHA